MYISENVMVFKFLNSKIGICTQTIHIIFDPIYICLCTVTYSALVHLQFCMTKYSNKLN